MRYHIPGPARCPASCTAPPRARPASCTAPPRALPGPVHAPLARGAAGVLKRRNVAKAPLRPGGHGAAAAQQPWGTCRGVTRRGRGGRAARGKRRTHRIQRGLGLGRRIVGSAVGAIGLGLAVQAIYSAGFGLFDEIYQRSLVMGFSVVAVLLATPLAGRFELRGARAALLWAVDLALVATMVLAIGWFLTVYDQTQSGLYEFSRTDQIVALAGVAVLLELARRTMGLPLFLFGVFAIVYCLAGSYLPWILRHSSYSLEETMRTMWYSFDGVFGLPASVMVGFIFVFIVFGTMLEGTGAGDILLKIAFGLTGRMRGGPAHAAIVASALFGSISGSVTANVVSTGVFTIPMIRKRGFTATFAGAVETAASSGGQFMPPVMGAAAFIMAELTGIPYLVICVAALLPALFYYASLFCSVLLEARRLGIGPLPPEQRERLVRSDWTRAQLFLIPIVVIVGVLALGRSPAMAGFWAVLAALGTGLFNPAFRGHPRRFVTALVRGGLAGARIMAALGVIGMIIAMMNMTGLGLRFSNLVLSFGDGSLLVSLLLTMAGCLVLGMGMPTVPAYLIIVLVMGPAIRELGVSVLLLHLFVLYFGVLSSITPPVAIAAYAAAPIAESNPFNTALVAVRISLIGFVIPFVFVYNPSLVLVDAYFSPAGLAWVLVRLTLTIWMFSTAFAGVESAPLHPLARVLRLAAGVAMVAPLWEPQLAGFLAAAMLEALPWLARRRRLAGATAPSEGAAR
jgi:TRAP transporter 4TM/12TM fusion protein